jgi:hypothetical protein
MRMAKRVAIAGGLVLLGVGMGVWIGRPHSANVDLGAAPPQYVPAGTLRLIDSDGVELAKLGIDLLPSLNVPLRIDFDNGPDGYLGWYAASGGSATLSLDAPPKDTAGPFGFVTLLITPGGAITVQSHPPDQVKEFAVPIKSAYAPPRSSAQWWIDLLFSRDELPTLQTELAAEDSRLVRRDGTPFAVCGHDRHGDAEIVFVSPDYAPRATLTFPDVQRGLSAPAFAMFYRKELPVALLETDSPRGPRLSVASEDRLSNAGYSLFPLDSTGTNLSSNSMSPLSSDAVVDWLAQPMYRARLPIKLVDAGGKTIWTGDGHQNVR